MDILIDWVTQIIIFIILAVIVDLLMPTNAMKKYIQFVVGLVLILIFLKPVLHLFNIDMKQAIESTYSKVIQSEEQVDNMDDLIKMQKSEIESGQDAYILEQMVVQLKTLAEEPLEIEHEKEIEDIQLVFKDDVADSMDNLEEVIVYLQELKEEEAAVDDVKEIIIDTEKEPKPDDDIDDTELEAIRDTLQEVWETGDEIKLSIIQEGGAS